jgi:uncharacterized Zn-binding protein involved in type VI secretion
MPEIAKVGISTVFGGPGAVTPGVIIGSGGGAGQLADGDIVSVVGDAIASHGPGAHAAATMVTGSPDTSVNGFPLVRVGDQASCLCTVIAGGDIDAFCV